MRDQDCGRSSVRPGSPHCLHSPAARRASAPTSAQRPGRDAGWRSPSDRLPNEVGDGSPLRRIVEASYRFSNPASGKPPDDRLTIVSWQAPRRSDSARRFSTTPITVSTTRHCPGWFQRRRPLAIGPSTGVSSGPVVQRGTMPTLARKFRSTISAAESAAGWLPFGGGGHKKLL